jgi:cell division protein FtsB
MKFGKKHSFTSYFHSKFGIAILLFLVVMLAQSVYGRYVVERQMAERRDALAKELIDLELRKNALEAKVDYMLGERGIEEEIRSNFDVARAGEQVVILVGEDTTIAEPMAPQEPVETKRWWHFWR